MRTLVILLLCGIAAYFAYGYFIRGENPLQGFNNGIPTKDSQGRDAVPCQRCTATGQITCTTPRCVNGQVPCPGPCLKLSDSGWRQMEGQDPNKLFMLYKVNKGVQGVSQAHVGEVFEVRFGEFYKLGPCKICGGTTSVPCKACGGTGKLTCPVCKGEKVIAKVLADAAPKAPAAATPKIQPVQPLAASAPRAEPVAPPPQKIFKLRDGRTVTGAVAIRDGTVIWVRTADGKRVEIKASEVVSEASP